MDEFTDGGFITVGEDPRQKDATAILARVDPIEEEIFSFRCLDPKPGIRALGCFAETDTFIALTWDCDLPPFKASTLNGYVSYNVRAV